MKNLYKNKYINYLYLSLLGTITALSLPPYNYFIINFFSLSLFFIFIVSKKTKLEKNFNYFKFGWFFGFGYFASSLFWIVISLSFDESFKILIPISIILIPSFLAIFYGIALYIFSFFKNYQNICLILIFSILFAIIEFIRGNILTGFPWNLFVFSFSNNLVFIQILSILGTYSFNMICITLFLTPAILVLKENNGKLYLCLFSILISISFLIFGNIKLDRESKISYKKNNYLIKVVSPKISIDRFYNVNTERQIIKDLIKLSNPDLNIPTIFIWPEGVLASSNVDDIKKYKELFSENFAEKHLIILGINDTLKNKNKLETYNSLIVVDNNLNIQNLYHKNNLVPFGEFLPLENYLTKLGLRSVTHGYQSFSAGEVRDVINLKNKYFDLNFLPLICYEIIYSGELSNNSNFDVIINISEDGWFGDSIGPKQHFVHSIFRAVEEGKNIIRSSNNGISAHIDGSGKIIKKLETTQSGVIDIIQYKYLKKTIFSQIQNRMFFYLLVIYISFVFFINKKESK